MIASTEIQMQNLVRRMEDHWRMMRANPNWEIFARIVDNTDLARAVQFDVNPIDILENGGWR